MFRRSYLPLLRLEYKDRLETGNIIEKVKRKRRKRKGNVKKRGSEMGKWRNGEMGKWGNGEMGKGKREKDTPERKRKGTESPTVRALIADRAAARFGER